MALVDNRNEVIGKIVEQAERPRPGTAPVKITRIVLNARAIAQFLHHLHIEVHAVFQTLGFQCFADFSKILGLLKHVILNLAHGGIEFGLRGDENVGGENGQFRKFLHPSARHRVEHFKTVDFVVPKHDTVGIISVSRKHIHRLPFYPEFALRELDFVAHIQGTHQGLCHIVASGFHSALQIDDVLAEIIRISDTVKT